MQKQEFTFRHLPHFYLRIFLLLLFVAFLVFWSEVIGFCPIRKLTGVICPGCGMTRAWLSVLHLDIRSAFRYHPMFWTFPVFLFFMFFDFRPFRRNLYNVLSLSALTFLIIICYFYRLFVLYL